MPGPRSTWDRLQGITPTLLVKVAPPQHALTPIEDRLWTFFQGRQFHWRRGLFGLSADPGFDRQFVSYSGLACDRRRNRLSRLSPSANFIVKSSVKLGTRRAVTRISLDALAPTWRQKLSNVPTTVDKSSWEQPLRGTKELRPQDLCTSLETVLPEVVAQELTSFLLYLGLDAPGASVLINAAKLVMEGISRKSLKNDRTKTTRVAEDFSASLLTSLTAEGVLKVLEVALAKNRDLLLLHSAGLVTGIAAMADPTGAASIVAGTGKGIVRFMLKLWELRATALMMNRVNPILAARGTRPEAFNMQLFCDFPLLACYATDATAAFDSSDFLGRTDPGDHGEVTAERARQIHEGLTNEKIVAMMAQFKGFQEVAHGRMRDVFCLLHLANGDVPPHCKGLVDRKLATVRKEVLDANARLAFRNRVAAQATAERPRHDAAVEVTDLEEVDA